MIPNSYLLSEPEIMREIVVPKPSQMWEPAAQRYIFPLTLCFSIAWSLELYDIFILIFTGFNDIVSVHRVTHLEGELFTQ